MKFVIEDWAGNELYKHGEFDTFEDGWDYLVEHFSEEEHQDLYVIEKKKGDTK